MKEILRANPEKFVEIGSIFAKALKKLGSSREDIEDKKYTQEFNTIQKKLERTYNY